MSSVTSVLSVLSVCRFYLSLLRKPLPGIDVSRMLQRATGVRDIVVHEYFGIDEDIIWDVVSVRTLS